MDVNVNGYSLSTWSCVFSARRVAAILALGREAVFDRRPVPAIDEQEGLRLCHVGRRFVGLLKCQSHSGVSFRISPDSDAVTA